MTGKLDVREAAANLPEEAEEVEEQEIVQDPDAPDDDTGEGSDGHVEGSEDNA